MRDYLLEELKKEIVGPGLSLQPGMIHPYADPITQEEILLVHVHGHPTQRYGAGILFPIEKSAYEERSPSKGDLEEDDDEPSDVQRPIEERFKGSQQTLESDDEGDAIIYTNQSRPSSMGLTIQCQSEGFLTIEMQSAYYELQNDKKTKWSYDKTTKNFIESKYSSNYYIRRPIQIEPVKVDLSTIREKGVFLDQVLYQMDDKEWLKLRIYNRSSMQDVGSGRLLLTFCLMNVLDVNQCSGGINGCSLFQNQLSILDEKGTVIQPYREKSLEHDPEMDQMNLLYRKKKSFGIGHGCAATWDKAEDDSVTYVKSSFLPTFEVPQIEANEDATISMYELSDICTDAEWESGKNAMILMVDAYKKWIDDLNEEINGWIGNPSLEKYTRSALLNIDKCRSNHERIRKGITAITKIGDLTPQEQLIIKCFRWMNRAMLWQQQRSKLPLRKWTGTRENVFLNPSIIHELKDFHLLGNGRWRPFQLAFILMNIESVWNDHSEDRSILDLIWFPTGGGKTEAYLGLTAFQIFTRRVRNITDKTYKHEKYSGTTVLMRYTLRLLTIQQYERAASLICACEIIRREQKNQSLGTDPISIGLWVGSDSTPNEYPEARQQYENLCINNQADYNFIVLKCPCCGAQIGQLDTQVRRRAPRKVRGIELINDRVRFRCEDPTCDTHTWTNLPLYVVDDDIFSIKPTLLISTVDKFAMITWKAGKENPNNESSRVQAGTIFGFRYDPVNGEVTRILPPQLIIQDELHLISGPLGTVVGIYETMVQKLCSDNGRTTAPFIFDGEISTPPKIIASSATISRAPEQVLNLYGIPKEKCNIFPPQGVEFGQTWFSRPIPTDVKPGRMYVGVLAPGYRSIQTAETRVYSRILQSCKSAEKQAVEKDAYWTLIGFFNSLRGLGSASTLVSSDISQYLKTLFNRELVHQAKRRNPGYLRFMELTSRINDSEIPKILERLNEAYTGVGGYPLDICMATNMIATGVDVPRLGLMVVHGQPKTTAEYIQASSRVGRNIKKNPLNDNEFIGQGLVVTIYSPNKPRDKSHYEQFQGYHSRIYSHVEPTSVTPFSINARQRALYAVFIGMIRQLSGGSLRYRPDGDGFEEISPLIKNLIVDRCELIDPVETGNVLDEIERLINEWINMALQRYGDALNTSMPNHRVMMYSPSAPIPPGYLLDRIFFPKPAGTSMRGVDQETQVRFLP